MPWIKSSPGSFSLSFHNALIEAWVSGSFEVPLQKDNKFWQREFSRFKFCIREHPMYNEKLTSIEATGLFRCTINPKNLRMIVSCRNNTLTWLTARHPDLLQSIGY
jgi:hypothetical protein